MTKGIVRGNRIPEIDFIKGIAIFSVLLLHTIPQSALDASFASLHIGQAVPIFLFITFSLSFNSLYTLKGNNIWSYYFSSKRLIRLIKEIALPFLIVVILQTVVNVLSHIYSNSFVIRDLYSCWGGIGPGNYYFWIYLQIWVIIPFLFSILYKLKWFGPILILLLSIILNIVCDWISLKPWIYRLFCVRYLFLSVPAYIMVDFKNKRKDLFPPMIIFCITVSFVYLVYLKDIDMSPYVLDYGWVQQQWPAFFWTYLLFVYLLLLGRRLTDTGFSRIIEVLGKNSWFIFLTQMFLLANIRISLLDFINNGFIRIVSFMFLIIFCSCIPVMLIRMIKTSRESRRNDKA